SPGLGGRLVQDRDVGDLAGRGEVVGVGAFEDGDVVLQVEGADQVRLALVQVHRALVDGRVRGCAVDGADDPAGRRLDEVQRSSAGRAEVGQVAGSAAVGP